MTPFLVSNLFVALPQSGYETSSMGCVDDDGLDIQGER